MPSPRSGSAHGQHEQRCAATSRSSSFSPHATAVGLLVAAIILGFARPAQAQLEPALERRLQLDYDDIVALRRKGRFREAAERFVALADSNPTSRLASRALASAGALYEWDFEDHDRARALFDRVLAGRDDVPGVMPALIQRLQIERDEKGPRAELALAEALHTKRPAAEYAPYLLMHSAGVLADDLGDREGALVRLKELIELFPRSTRADEAAMKSGELLRALHRPEHAILAYRTIIDTQSTSLIVGEYNSTKLDDAYFELAETYRKDLHDPARAEEAYLTLVEEVPLSRYVDDALHFAAACAAQRGDPKRAAEHLAKLAKLRPASRFLPKAARGSDP